MKRSQLLAKFTFNHWSITKIVAFLYVLKKFSLLAPWRTCLNFTHLYLFFEYLNFHEHGSLQDLLERLTEDWLGGKYKILPQDSSVYSKLLRRKVLWNWSDKQGVWADKCEYKLKQVVHFLEQLLEKGLKCYFLLFLIQQTYVYQT